METNEQTKGESIAPSKDDAARDEVAAHYANKYPHLYTPNDSDTFKSVKAMSDSEAIAFGAMRLRQSGKTRIATRLDSIASALAQGVNHVTLSTDSSGELSVTFTDLAEVPDFIEASNEIAKFRGALNAGKNIMLTGEAGSGKTNLVQYMAKVERRPLIEVQGGAGANFERIVGKDTLEERNGASVMGWADAILPLAMNTENAILYFDEPNSIPTDVLFYLHPAMDYRRTITYANGKSLKAKKGFTVVGAMNEGYAGTNVLNAAFRSRTVGIPLTYLGSRKEQSLLVKRAGIDKDFARKLVSLANNLREQAKTNRQMRTPISTRSLLDAADLVKVGGLSEIDAVNMAILEQVPAQYTIEKKAVSDAIAAYFGLPKKTEADE